MQEFIDDFCETLAKIIMIEELEDKKSKTKSFN